MPDYRILVTGTAGFIGHHLALALQQRGHQVVGLDSINSYYLPQLKYDRLALQGFAKEQIHYNELITSSLYPNLHFIQLDLADHHELESLFRNQQFDIVINLAAQAGVRYSMEHPQSYVGSNLVGFANVLEACRQFPVKHLLFASSSSVYGLHTEVPFATTHSTDHPISFYAATKKANEVMAHSYAHLYHIPTTGLRFFTVYGPWGRPDMAYYSFASAIARGETIRIFNYGDMHRDFTYIDDVVNSIVRLLEVQPTPATALSRAPYKLYNIGNNQPVQLMDFVGILERELGKKAHLELLPMQPGDVPITYADVEDLMQAVDYRPNTPLAEGLKKTMDWFKTYYAEELRQAPAVS
ncbi:NAD-dependent epimerase/dehydratase family protein [Pontibacter liquoris]|uniref:NAD-dependent epimerase/dehydratase family protein n=1 Tax=Pontibacter liquoris TaxID=2905677 RepID=UPI001FA7E000|nr:NAD-dependent epimerase/dehydratase family protein [Pontibacter liquoris]